MGSLNLLRTAALAASILVLSGCGDPNSSNDSPFGPAVVRLGDAVAAEVDGTPIYVSGVRREGVGQGLIDRGDPLGPGSPLYDQLLEELVDQRQIGRASCRERV